MSSSLRHNQRLRRIFAILTLEWMIITPFIFFAFVYRFETARLETAVEDRAKRITELISSSPDFWKFKVSALQMIVSTRSKRGDHELNQIFDESGSLVVESADKLAPFALTRSFQLWDAGREVGTLKIQRSIAETCLQTLIVFLFMCVFGPSLYYFVNKFVIQKLLIAETEQELLRAKMITSDKLASLGTMVAGVAHEVNNPLTIISGTVNLLPKYANDPEQFAAKIATIHKSIERILKIVSGLRKFSRNTVTPAFQNYSVAEIIRESVVLTQFKAKQEHTTVSCDLKTESQILCDPLALEQVVINLINNAIDATKDKPEKWVKVEVLDEAHAVVLQVTDSGSGIPQVIRNKIFDPFFTTKAIGEGTGLGLSIVKGILDEHKATIGVRADRPNTCFEVCFPKRE